MNDFRAHARRGDLQTSHRAAEAVTPRIPTIRQQVEDYARGRGPEGFIDEELSEHFGEVAATRSSYRTRRSELTVENRILDTRRLRRNSLNLECEVWVHRDHHPDPPPIVAAVRGKARDVLKGEAMAHVAKLRLLAAGLRRQGLGPAAAEVEQGAELLAKLAR